MAHRFGRVVLERREGWAYDVVALLDGSTHRCIAQHRCFEALTLMDVASGALKDFLVVGACFVALALCAEAEGAGTGVELSNLLVERLISIS